MDNLVNQLPKLAVIAFIAWTVGAANALAGKMPEPNQEPYSHWLPVQLMIVLGGVAVLSYIAGRIDVQNKHASGDDQGGESNG